MTNMNPEAEDPNRVLEFDDTSQLEVFFKSKATDGVITTDTGKRVKLREIEDAWNWFVNPEQEHEWPEFMPSTHNYAKGRWVPGSFPSVRHWINVISAVDSSQDSEIAVQTVPEKDFDAIDMLLILEMDKPEGLRQTIRLVDHHSPEEGTN